MGDQRGRRTEQAARDRAWWPFALGIVLAVGALVHWPALRTFFAQDDVTFHARAMGLAPTPWSLARPLSVGLTWRAAHALFGLNPLPYHVMNLVLHLTSAALVAAIGGRLGLGRSGSLAAALLFAATPIAFTPTHWASGIQEIQATVLALAAFWLWLVGRERGSTPLLWAGALTGAAAVLSKENAVLLPVVLIVANVATTQARPWRVIVPQATLMLAFVVAFVATRAGHHLGGEAYSRDFSPGFLIVNFATYLRWCVSPHVPVPDFHAIANSSALPVGAAVVLALAALLWMARKAPPHPETVGIVWFLAMLAPVLPLAHHTYLYYLYLPWAGMCWGCAGAGERLAHRWPVLRAPLLVLLVLVVALDFWSVRARERETLGPFASDKVVRESRLLERCLSQLRALGLPPGTRIAFVNPGVRGRVEFGTSQVKDSVTSTRSYLPLEAVLRDGEALRVFTPQLQYAGFASSLPREWEDARVLLFNDQADLMDLGTGSHALAQLGMFCLEVRNWETADSLFRRSRMRGDTLPDATFGLVLTTDGFGQPAESDRYAREFLRRWPHDPRAAYLDSVLRASSGAPR